LNIYGSAQPVKHIKTSILRSKKLLGTTKGGNMKKNLARAMLVLMLLIGINKMHAQDVSIDEAVKNAAGELTAGLDRNARVGVLYFQSDSEDMTDYLVDGMISALTDLNSFSVVDRAQLNQIFGGQQFRLSGNIDDRTAQTFGKQMGVQYIVMGKLERNESAFRLSARMVDGDTADVHKSYEAIIQRSSTTTALLGIEKTNEQGQRELWEIQQEFRQKQRGLEKLELQEELLELWRWQWEEKQESILRRKNWLSTEINYGPLFFSFPDSYQYSIFDRPSLGVGVRYDRKITNHLNLGTHFFYAWILGSVLTNGNYWGMSASARLFPGRGTFYFEIDAGWGLNSYDYEGERYDDNNKKYNISPKISGFMLTPAIGWRLITDRKVIFNPNFAVPIIFGEDGISFLIIWRIGMGYAW